MAQAQEKERTQENAGNQPDFPPPLDLSGIDAHYDFDEMGGHEPGIADSSLALPAVDLKTGLAATDPVIHQEMKRLLETMNEPERINYIISLGEDQEKIFTAISVINEILANNNDIEKFTIKLDSAMKKRMDMAANEARNILNAAQAQPLVAPNLLRKMAEPKQAQNHERPASNNGDDFNVNKRVASPSNSTSTKQAGASENRRQQSDSESPIKGHSAGSSHDEAVTAKKPREEAGQHKNVFGEPEMPAHHEAREKPGNKDVGDQHDHDNGPKGSISGGQSQKSGGGGGFSFSPSISFGAGAEGLRNIGKDSIDNAAKIGAAVAGLVSLPKKKYVTDDFKMFEKSFETDRAKSLHDAGSSVPFVGQVFPDSEIDFSITQGERLEKIVSGSPLDYSPEDKFVMKRAEAAKREKLAQATESSKVEMDAAEKVMQSKIDYLRNGPLLKMGPLMDIAKSPEEIRQLFSAGIGDGSINSGNFSAGIKDFYSSFDAYSSATKAHIKNLSSADNESEAQDVLDNFIKKSSAANKKAFLDEIGSASDKESFTGKINELAEELSNMLKEFLSSFKSSSDSSPS